MCILVTGASGQLGSDIIDELAENSLPYIGLCSKNLDITNKNDVIKTFKKIKPTMVIHCAAYTSVEKAQLEEKEKCIQVNVQGTKNIVDCCATLNIPIVYISTDFVFDGTGSLPWSTEDIPNPINVYGQSKYDGEKIVLSTLKNFYIIRISWVFGQNGNNFVKTMINLARTHKEIRVVDDQIGAPTYTVDAAKLIITILKSNKYGIYHVSNEGACSWAEFADKIFSILNLETRVIPIKSSELNSIVNRPLNSRLNTEKLVLNGFTTLPSWEDALKRYLK